MYVEKDVDGDLATFILWAPEFGPSSSTNGLEQDTWISKKTKLISAKIDVKLRNSFKFSNSFSTAESSSLCVSHRVGAGYSFTVSGR